MSRIFFVIGLLLLQASSSPLMAATQFVVGTARDSKGKVAFIEVHEQTLEGDTLTELKAKYFAPNSTTPFATLNSDFTKSPFFPNYEFSDSRFERFEKVKFEKDQIEGTIKKNRESEEEKVNKPADPSWIAGQGVYNFLRESKLAFENKGAIVKRVMFFPMRKTHIDVQIRLKSKTENVAVLALELDSFFFRIFAPEIEMKMDFDTKRLLQFSGSTHILDANQKEMWVEIQYSPPASEFPTLPFSG